MESLLAALLKNLSSPDYVVCPSQFTLDIELWLLLSCCHAFHAACVDTSFRIEIGNVSYHSSSTASCGNNLPTHSLDSFEYHIDKEVEVIVSYVMPMTTKTAVL
uniref:RING-type domain-containing protein n=1 Tax=Oryza meridionalis TaxID=40149 RepID=A0A0E0CZQ9_9ORYZ